MPKPREWTVWTYALNPGWEANAPCPTRAEAREMREELIDVDGYPPEFVVIRPLDDERTPRQPSSAVIAKVRAALALEESHEAALRTTKEGE